MTLNIIFAIGIAAGVPFMIWQSKMNDSWSCWRGVLGLTISIACLTALFISVLCWLCSEKDSEIRYMQLLQEKQTIESMIDTENDIDRLLLNERVISYNNRVIETRENSTRFILGDYYSDSVDWTALELIEWR